MERGVQSVFNLKLYFLYGPRGGESLSLAAGEGEYRRHTDRERHEETIVMYTMKRFLKTSYNDLQTV